MASLQVLNQGDFINLYIQAKDSSTNTEVSSLNNDPLGIHMTLAQFNAEQLALLNITFATLLTEIELIRASKQPHNLQWYINNVLNFQYGYTPYIEETTNILKYSTTNEDAKIIEGCTGYASSNKIRLKVRRKDNILLTEDEKLSLHQTVTLLSDAGKTIIIENYEGDRFTVNGDIIYTGDTLENITTKVNTAIETYLNNLSFNSKFYMDDLLASIKQVENVKHVSIDSVIVLDADNISTNVSIEYETKAGYGVLNNVTPGTINYKKEY